MNVVLERLFTPFTNVDDLIRAWQQVKAGEGPAEDRDRLACRVAVTLILRSDIRDVVQAAGNDTRQEPGFLVQMSSVSERTQVTPLLYIAAADARVARFLIQNPYAIEQGLLEDGDGPPEDLLAFASRVPETPYDLLNGVRWAAPILLQEHGVEGRYAEAFLKYLHRADVLMRLLERVRGGRDVREQLRATVSDFRRQVRIQTLAVMFTDMAGSTAFAERYGSRPAFEKRQEHNRLLVPLITAHRGTFVEKAGDALLAIFDDATDAARCAVAIQRRLEEHNATEAELEDHEIHVRAGIHYGKAVVYREPGHLEVAGRAVNMAARVEAGSGKKTDQILLSDAAQSRLMLHPVEFITESLGLVEAKGIGLLSLHRLLWKQKELATALRPPAVLAAKTDKSLGEQVAQEEARRAVHALFVDEQSGRGHVLPVWIEVSTGQSAGIRARHRCDPEMQTAAKSAVQAATEVLVRLGLANARPDQQAIDWWVQGPDIHYEGASLGLAVALAVVAASTGTEIDPGVAVTGAVNGGKVLRVAGIGSKWEALSSSGRFDTLVVPTENLGDLPASVRASTNLKVIDVPTVEAAVQDVLGAALNLPASGLAARINATPAAASGGVDVQLWVQPAGRRELTRDIGIVPEEDVHSWAIGDRLRVCVQASRDCHLVVINVGSSGKVTILLPNNYHLDTAVRSGQVVTFPAPTDRFHFELLGPPGRERLIALASGRPLHLRPEDFDQSGQLVCARLTTRDIAVVADDITADLLGRCEVGFYVSAREASVSSLAPPRITSDPAPETASAFRPLDLG